MIIGLSGYAQSGKDTVAKILVEEYGFTRIAFADKIKEFLLSFDKQVNDAVTLYGWEGAKQLHHVRRSLQDIGIGARKVFGEDFWVEQAIRGVIRHPSALTNDFVFTDVRFTNEAQEIKEWGGHIWRVERPGINPANDHVSESELNAWNFDSIIYNSGTIEDLSDVIAYDMEFPNGVR